MAPRGRRPAADVGASGGDIWSKMRRARPAPLDTLGRGGLKRDRRSPRAEASAVGAGPFGGPRTPAAPARARVRRCVVRRGIDRPDRFPLGPAALRVGGSPPPRCSPHPAGTATTGSPVNPRVLRPPPQRTRAPGGGLEGHGSDLSAFGGRRVRAIEVPRGGVRRRLGQERRADGAVAHRAAARPRPAVPTWDLRRSAGRRREPPSVVGERRSAWPASRKRRRSHALGGVAAPAGHRFGRPRRAGRVGRRRGAGRPLRPAHARP